MRTGPVSDPNSFVRCRFFTKEDLEDLVFQVKRDKSTCENTPSLQRNKF